MSSHALIPTRPARRGDLSRDTSDRASGRRGWRRHRNGRGWRVLVPDDGEARSRLAPAILPLRSFVRSIVSFRGRLWLGTFDDGFYVVDAAEDVLADPSLLARAQHVRAPFRMITDATVANGALYVGANEGLFVTKDGSRFARVDEVSSRVTSLAQSGGALYATTTSALWRVPTRRGSWDAEGPASRRVLVARRQSVAARSGR